MLADVRVTRLVVLLTAGSIPLLAGCSSVRWEHSYEAGLAKAARQRQRAVVMFDALNPDCLEMDRKVFSDREVQEVMKQYVPIRLDHVLNHKLAERFNVQVAPTFVIVRPDVVRPEGVPVGLHAGKMDATKFKYFLIKYRRS